MEMVNLDQGYYFGMGVFETIAVEEGKPLFLEWHLERMRKGLQTLGISCNSIPAQITQKKICTYLQEHPMTHGVLKIMASEKNLCFATRQNPYTEKEFEKGMRLVISEVLRNETSVFPYIKSFHYGDNLLEKQKARENGYEDALFCNTKGELTETTAANIFFVKDGGLYTPKVSCGLLEGIGRKYIMQTYPVKEIIIRPEELCDYEEAFLTNSLMGVMPVISVGEKTLSIGEHTREIYRRYQKEKFF